MAEARPELVFLAGPQKGERAVVMSDRATAGRSPSAEIVLQESFASREHVRLEFTDDGWVMESLSSRGTLVNGKRYRPGRKVILDTGDVLSIGMETEILFVAAGDDPEAAVRAWREANPETTPPAAPAAEASGPPTPVSPPGRPAPRSAAPRPTVAEAKPAKGVAPTPDAVAAAARRARVRKYGIGAGIYVGLLVVLILVLRSFRGEEPTGPGGMPRLMSDREIDEAIAGQIARISPSPIRAAECLVEALQLWNSRRPGTGDTYRCVKFFRLHLAYKGMRVFERTSDEDIYNRARQMLVGEVTEKYKAAFKLAAQGNWERAKRDFGDLLQLIPATQDPLPELQNPFYLNLADHVAYAGAKIAPR